MDYSIGNSAVPWDTVLATVLCYGIHYWQQFCAMGYSIGNSSVPWDTVFATVVCHGIPHRISNSAVPWDSVLAKVLCHGRKLCQQRNVMGYRN